VACREAFMAVLASVCDPHLNTIHAVCRRFSESRGLAPFGHSLHPPRPVDRPLNIYHQYSTPHLDTTSFNPYNFPTPPDFAQPTADLILFHNLFNTVTPPTAYIPAQGSEGPLSLPYLEPAHPVFGLEMDCADIWGCVLTVIDMSRADAEALASSLTEKVRCYGFGPVIMKRDVMEVCEGECIAWPRRKTELIGR